MKWNWVRKMGWKIFLPQIFLPVPFPGSGGETAAYRTTSKAKPFRYSVSGMLGMTG